MPSGLLPFQEDETDGSAEVTEARVSDRPARRVLGSACSCAHSFSGRESRAGRVGADVLCAVWRVAAVPLSALR